MSTNNSLASRILNGSITYWDYANTQAALSSFNVQISFGSVSTVDFKTNTIYLSNNITSDAALYREFVHELSHLRDGAIPEAWGRAFDTANLGLAISTNVYSEASAIASTIIATGGVQIGQWLGPYATNSELASAVERADLLMPQSSVFYKAVLADEIAAAIINNPIGYSIIASRVSRVWVDHFQNAKSGTPADPANNSSGNPNDQVAMGDAVSISTSIESLGELESVSVIQLPDGRKIIIVTRPDGSQDAHEVNDSSFHWTFSAVPLETLMPGWYLNVPSSGQTPGDELLNLELTAKSASTETTINKTAMLISEAQSVFDAAGLQGSANVMLDYRCGYQISVNI